MINQNNDLLVNEIAPRVHNSGHLTINIFNVSQFEGHIRAVCNLGIVSLKKITNAEMINILGKDLDSKKVDKAITLSAEKYCSASIMLGKTAKITAVLRTAKKTAKTPSGNGAS